MGSSVAGIVSLLARESVFLVAIAFAVACPVAWYAVSRWLQTFTFHIDVGPLPFIVAGAIVLAVAWLTVSLQSLRAAYADPVDSLQYE